MKFYTKKQLKRLRVALIFESNKRTKFKKHKNSNVNNFNNQENPQIMIDTYEIVGRQDYYF